MDTKFKSNSTLGNKNRFWNGFKKFSLDLPVVYMLIVVCVVMGFLNRNFFSMANIISMLTSYSYYIIGAIGLVFVFLSGNSGIDLSIGYVTGFSAVVSTKTMSLLSDANPDMNPWLIIVLGLLVSCTIGALFGLLNGIAVAKFHIAPFIITLASQLLAMGLCYVFTNGYTVSGGPRELSGIFAGIAAMFIPMCIGGVNPDVGANLLMPMVAAVTIGGISQSGGYGNMVQAGFGILFIMCLMSAMTFLGFGLPTQQLAYGIVIVFTMTLLGYIERKRFRV